MRIIAGLEVINFDHYQGLSVEGDRGTGQLVLKSRDGVLRPIANFDERRHAIDAFSSFCDALTTGDPIWTIPDFTDNVDEPWTTERFREFVSKESPENFDFYESKNEDGTFYKMAVDLLNLVREKNWQLTPGCRKSYFCLYGEPKRRMFGVNLMGPPRLAVWISYEDAESLFANTVEYERYDHERTHAIYPQNTTVEEIEPFLDFTYSEA